MGYPETVRCPLLRGSLHISIPRSEWATLKPGQSRRVIAGKGISIPRSEWATLKRPNSPAILIPSLISIPRSEWATLKPSLSKADEQ